MKVKVLIPFRDKHTGKTYEKGEVIEVTAERFAEIITKGKYIELVKEEAKQTKA